MDNCIIGDLHGNQLGVEIAKRELNEGNSVTFVGDYFDSKELTIDTQIYVFLAIIKLQEEFKDKLTLLMGNHDYHYIPEINIKCNGYRKKYSNLIGDIISELISKNKLQVAKLIDNILITHAGVTTTWANNNGYKSGENIQDWLNYLFYSNINAFELLDGGGRGDEITQSPLMVRSESLIADKLPGFKQVVGHTKSKNIRFMSDITFIDTIKTSAEYLKITTGGIFIPETYHEYKKTA